MPEVGDYIGSIRIVGVLGEGGMGEVYRGFDETLQRRVALKTIRKDRSLDPSSKARFLREARVLSRLEHRNICRIYDYIESDDAEYLVLELIEGMTLDRALQADTSKQKRLEIVRQIAGVLAAAHAEGIIHRDLKPGNVMLTPGGYVKVLDFGLARAEDNPVSYQPSEEEADSRESDQRGSVFDSRDATLDLEDHETLDDAEETLPLVATDGPASSATPFALLTMKGSVVGTPLYMSPEQARGEPISTASDMYSLGLLIQNVFTGQEPYPRNIGVAELIERTKKGESRPFDGSDADLTNLVGRLKSVVPTARPTAVATLERLDWIRDKPKRRVRRLVVGLVVAAIALSGVKYTLDLRRERTAAVAARELADQRRDQAEDLIGFMLGDLRQKLEPLGQLETLDDVGQKAMDYYAAVDESELSDEELLSRSKALYQIGEVRIAEGQLDEALAPLEESLSLARSLVERDPSDGTRLFEAGQAHFWVGFAHWRRGELDRALEEFEEYLEISERLVEMDPGKLDWKLELSYAHSNIGSILQTQGDLKGALERFEATLALNDELVAADPDNDGWQQDLARSYNTVGYILESMGDFEGALESYRDEQQIKNDLLAKKPDHARWQYELAISHTYIGQLRGAMGERDACLDHYRESIDALESLTALDSANTPWARQLASSLYLNGRALIEMGELDRAGAELKRSIEIMAGLVSQDREDAGWQRDLAASRTQLALVLTRSGDPVAGLAAAQNSRSQLEALLEERQEDREARVYLSEAHAALGESWERRGEHDRAMAEWRRAAKVIEDLASDSSDRRVLVPWVRALKSLGRTEEANSVIERLTAYGYRIADRDKDRQALMESTG